MKKLLLASFTVVLAFTMMSCNKECLVPDSNSDTLKSGQANIAANDCQCNGTCDSCYHHNNCGNGSCDGTGCGNGQCDSTCNNHNYGGNNGSCNGTGCGNGQGNGSCNGSGNGNGNGHCGGGQGCGQHNN